jgi:hypothetical protein
MVYIRTEKGVLIEVKPNTRIPRTFKRFAGLMCKFYLVTYLIWFDYISTTILCVPAWFSFCEEMNNLLFLALKTLLPCSGTASEIEYICYWQAWETSPHIKKPSNPIFAYQLAESRFVIVVQWFWNWFQTVLSSRIAMNSSLFTFFYSIVL